MFLGENKLWAVSKALDIAKKRVNMLKRPVTIFCDLQKALKAIALPPTCQGNRVLQGLIY